MRHSLNGWLFVALMVTVAGRHPAAAQQLASDRFSQWNYCNDKGWRAFYRGDLEGAARCFTAAIEAVKSETEGSPKLMARSYADLAWVLYRQGRAEEAQPLARWARDVRVQQLGADAEPVAQSQYELAMIATARQDYDAAEPMFRSALAIWERRLGPSNSRVVPVLNDYAALLVLQRKYEHAASEYQKVLNYPERILPANHVARASSLIGLARLYLSRGERDKSRSLDERIWTLLGNLAIDDFAEIVEPLGQYTARLRQLGLSDEADALEERSRAIEAKIAEPRQRSELAPRAAGTKAPVPRPGLKDADSIGLQVWGF